MTITTVESESGRVEHIVRPISLEYTDDPTEYLIVCGQQGYTLTNETHERTEEQVIARDDICKNCLISAGIIDVPQSVVDKRHSHNG